MQCRVGLVRTQHNVRVQMSRVMIPLIQCKIPLCVKDGGFVEVGIEACPNERVEALKKVGQVSWGRFGLVRLHAFQAGRQTRRGWRIGRSAGGRCDPQVASKVCVRLNQLVSLLHHVIYAFYLIYLDYSNVHVHHAPALAL